MKTKELNKYLKDNYESSNSKKVTIKSRIDEEVTDFIMTLYYYVNNDETKDLSWDWIFNQCDVTINTQVQIRPKAILLIKHNDDTYAASFGSAYYYPNLYSNKDWAFEYAKKVNFKRIKLTASTIPNSKRNKQINTYVNYNEYTPTSGESLNQLDIDIELDSDDEELVGNNFKIGNSLKLTLKNNELESIAEVIDYVNFVCSKNEIINNFPRLTEITGNDEILKYDNKIKKVIYEDYLKDIKEYPVDLSQFFTFDVNLKFIKDFNSFIISFKDNKEEFKVLTMDKLYGLMKKWKIKLEDDFLENIKITFFDDGIHPISEVKLKNILHYDNIEDECILCEGKWQKYNTEYLTFLADSLSEIKVCEKEEFSLYTPDYLKFMKEKYMEEKEKTEITDEDFLNLNNDILKKYTQEAYFNIYCAKKNYELWDQKFRYMEGHRAELMDLYGNKTAISVKIGYSSGKLSYVVDQSLEGLILIRNYKDLFDEEIDNVGIWLILETDKSIRDEDNNIDINKLKFLIFKNKLDYWKKEVLLMGYKPVIYINYKYSGNYKDNFLKLNPDFNLKECEEYYEK